MSQRTINDINAGTPHRGSSDRSGGIDERQIPVWVLPALLTAVALLYIATLRPGHAWHDDFALYVLHARNLVEGIPYGATGYIYNPGNPWHSPGVYPPGFPLLLAPVYALFGADLFALKLVVVASFVAAMAVFGLLIRPLLPARYFLAVMLLVTLQPFFARFKNLLLPDYTFLLLAFSSLYLLRRLYRDDPAARSWGIAVAAGFCMAGAFSVRAVGVALFAGLALYQVLQFRLPRLPVVIAGTTAMTLVALQFLIMPSESGYAAQIVDAAAGGDPPPIYEVLLWQARQFIGSIGVLWAPREDLAIGAMTSLESVLMKGLTVVTAGLAGAGLLIRLRRPTLLETFVLAYSAVILYWGFISARYLIPLVPFLVLYAVVTLRFVLSRGGAGVRYGVIALTLVVSGSYIANLAQLQTRGYSADVTDARASELFAYLRRCAEDVRLVAERPRAIALFTERQAASLNRSQAQPDRFAEMATTMELDYLVTFRGSSIDSAAAYIPGLRSTFENDGFLVYRLPAKEGRPTCP